MKVTFYYIVFIIFFCSCNSKNKNLETTNTHISEKEYHRDSLYLDYTVNQFIEHKYRGYDFYDSANSKVYIDTILYSPDKLKLFSLLIIEKRKIEQGKPFHGMAVIAYREDTSDIWKVYPVTKYGVSWSDFQGARNVLRRCYFEEIKGDNDNQGNEFKHNLGDSNFWSDLYFKKGYDIDSLYYFQTELNKETSTLKRKKDGIIPYLEIDYPQEIIELY